jgi:hypothetical protein
VKFKRVLNLGHNPRRDVDEEIAFHFESRVGELAQQGHSPGEARRMAEQEFGDVRRVRHELLASTRRRASRRSRLEAVRDLASDLAYVGRSVARSPGLAITIALTLGLGIGASATMYGVVDRLLLRGPEHVVDAGSLRRVYAHVRTKSSGEFTTSVLAYAAYTIWRDNARSVAHAAAYATTDARVGRGLDAKLVRLGNATPDFFTTLGVHPVRGRFFNAAEDIPPDGTHVVVLDHGYWMRAFGGSDSAIGRPMTIDDRQFTVIGVAPSGFTGAELRPVDLWAPMSTGSHPTTDWPVTWRADWVNTVIRPSPGLTRKQVDDDLTETFRASYGGSDREWKSADISARPIGFTALGKERPEASIARWLSAVALLVLIIATGNVAN